MNTCFKAAGWFWACCPQERTIEALSIQTISERTAAAFWEHRSPCAFWSGKWKQYKIDQNSVLVCLSWLRDDSLVPLVRECFGYIALKLRQSWTSGVSRTALSILPSLNWIGWRHLAGLILLGRRRHACQKLVCQFASCKTCKPASIGRLAMHAHKRKLCCFPSQKAASEFLLSRKSCLKVQLWDVAVLLQLWIWIIDHDEMSECCNCTSTLASICDSAPFKGTGLSLPSFLPSSCLRSWPPAYRIFPCRERDGAQRTQCVNPYPHLLTVRLPHNTCLVDIYRQN